MQWSGPFLFVFLWLYTAIGLGSEIQSTSGEVVSPTLKSDSVLAKAAGWENVLRSNLPLSDKLNALTKMAVLEPFADEAPCSFNSYYANLAELLMQLKASRSAIYCSRKALEMSRKCKDTPPERIYTEMGRIGAFYLQAGQLDSAIYYFKVSSAFADSIEDPLWVAASMNNLGMAWSAAGRPDSAYLYYSQAIFRLNPANTRHRAFLSNVQDNLADWYYKQGEPKVACQYHDENMEMGRQFGDTALTLHALLKCGSIRLEQGELGEVSVILSHLEEYIGSYAASPKKKTGLMLEYHRFLQDASFAMHDLRSAMEAGEQIKLLEQRKDSIAMNRTGMVTNALWDMNRAKTAHERSLLEQIRLQQQKDRTLHYLGIGAIVILLLLVVRIVLRSVKQR